MSRAQNAEKCKQNDVNNVEAKKSRKKRIKNIFYNNKFTLFVHSSEKHLEQSTKRVPTAKRRFNFELQLFCATSS